MSVSGDGDGGADVSFLFTAALVLSEALVLSDELSISKSRVWSAVAHLMTFFFFFSFFYTFSLSQLAFYIPTCQIGGQEIRL